MPIRTEWLIAQRIVLAQIIGDVSREDLQEHITVLQAFMEEVDDDQNVDYVQDTRLIGKPYSNFAEVKKMLGFMRRLPGWYLVLNRPGNFLFGFIASVTAQMVGIKTRPPFDDYASLKAFMKERYADLELPDTLPALFTPEEIADIQNNQAKSSA